MKHRLPVIVVLIAVALAAIVAPALTYVAYARADRMQDAAYGLAQVQTLVSRMQAARCRARSMGSFGAAVATSMEDMQTEVRDVLDEHAHTGGEWCAIDEATDGFEDYVEATTIEMRLVNEGKSDQAEAYAEDRVRDAYHTLDQALRTSAERHYASAGLYDGLAFAGVALSAFLVGATLVGGVVWLVFVRRREDKGAQA